MTEKISDSMRGGPVDRASNPSDIVPRRLRWREFGALLALRKPGGIGAPPAIASIRSQMNSTEKD
jgi:hypothetical protein